LIVSNSRNTSGAYRGKLLHPAARMTMDKYYAMYSGASHAALTEHLTDDGGKKFELVKLSTDQAKRRDIACCQIRW
jgi:hypothetical protein